MLASSSLAAVNQICGSEGTFLRALFSTCGWGCIKVQNQKAESSGIIRTAASNTSLQRPEEHRLFINAVENQICGSEGTFFALLRTCFGGECLTGCPQLTYHGEPDQRIFTEPDTFCTRSSHKSTAEPGGNNQTGLKDVRTEDGSCKARTWA